MAVIAQVDISRSAGKTRIEVAVNIATGDRAFTEVLWQSFEVVVPDPSKPSDVAPWLAGILGTTVNAVLDHERAVRDTREKDSFAGTSKTI